MKKACIISAFLCVPWLALAEETLSGIGIRVSERPGKGLVVEKIIPDGPADRAGNLKQGDLITGVSDGQGSPVSLADKSKQEAMALIHGKTGTTIKLTVEKEISITRGEAGAAKPRLVARTSLLEVGAEAPNIPFEVLADGSMRQFSSLKGQVVVIDFWATWCTPCQKPLAKMQTYAEKHPAFGDQVVFMTLSTDRDKSRVKPYLERNGWDKTYNAWSDTAGRAYGISTIPIVYIIDQEGFVAARGHPITLDIPDIVAGLLNKEEPFNPADFKLSDLVQNLDAGNHFKLPAKTRPFLRQVLDSGADVQFKTTNRGGTHAYISHDLSPNIWINPASGPKRLGEAICHELLHFQDMKQFKPINGFKPSGLSQDQLKIFQPMVRDLVNMISHEYVKKRLVEFGYVNPMGDNAKGRMQTLSTGVATTEKALADVSKKLAKTPDRKTPLTMVNLQAVYQNFMLMTLRDELLFDNAHKNALNALMVRYQALLDYMNRSTADDPRFKRVYLQVKKPADAIRRTCKAFQASGGSTRERYVLLADTLNHIYQHVGVSFGLVGRASQAPALKVTSTLFKPDESFVLDGNFTFSKVRLFVPGGEAGNPETKL